MEYHVPLHGSHSPDPQERWDRAFRETNAAAAASGRRVRRSRNSEERQRLDDAEATKTREFQIHYEAMHDTAPVSASYVSEEQQRLDGAEADAARTHELQIHRKVMNGVYLEQLAIDEIKLMLEIEASPGAGTRASEIQTHRQAMHGVRRENLAHEDKRLTLEREALEDTRRILEREALALKALRLKLETEEKKAIEWHESGRYIDNPLRYAQRCMELEELHKKLEQKLRMLSICKMWHKNTGGRAVDVLQYICESFGGIDYVRPTTPPRQPAGPDAQDLWDEAFRAQERRA